MNNTANAPAVWQEPEHIPLPGPDALAEEQALFEQKMLAAVRRETHWGCNQ